jgi:hypothetical protein
MSFSLSLVTTDMLIRTRIGITVDGFIATRDGSPAFVVMPDFSPHESYGWPEFDDQIEAVVLGRIALDAFLELGAVDRLELLQFPVLLGEGVPFSLPRASRTSLRLQEHDAFGDGTVRHVYTLE